MSPYLHESSSSGSGGLTPVSVASHGSDNGSVIEDSEYPALQFPGYAEKPLSEQLEPIAVVGMGCRLPGDVSSPAQFWDLMINKGTGQTPKVPSDRFNIDAHFHENNERPGSFNVLGGYFIKNDIKEFDPQLFGISPVEAMWMDPQQRKLLEVVYEAFESGGVTLDTVSGSQTAVFVGSFTSDYQQMSFKEPDFRHSYAATGVDPGIISNRISHVFNLHGPSILVNTACSSSVYAMHNACNALRNHECTAAVVGGTNLIITVDQHMNTAKLGVLSPTSTCHTFDASADGYGRADGVGAVYLKRLSDAVRDGDPIRAVIRTSAVNSNGKAPAVGITHPNLEGQVDVIKHAYLRGGDLDPKLTGYFEIHGTGTPIGDPLEVHAVAKAMNGRRLPGEEPLLIGAVKTNIGHSEAASGLSAVIKAVLTVENGIIPPTRGLVNRNPKIDWDGWKVQVVTDPRPFPSHLPVKRVSVNSFGYGGTNGHIMIEGIDSFIPDYKLARKSTTKPRGMHNLNRPFLLPFSAHDKQTLKHNIGAYSKIAGNYNLLDLSYTLANRRSLLQSRGFVVSSYAALESAFGDNLAAFSFAEKKKTPRIGFAFTGQGAQWARMGSQLMTYYPSFLRTIIELDYALGSLPDAPEWTLEDKLLEDAQTSRVNEAEFSQPLCTAIQIATVKLLESWDIRPQVTVGHSSGEIAAAYAAGLISASEAIIVAYYRGQVVAKLNTNGAMMAVGLGAEAVEPFIREFKGQVVIACHNSPVSVTLSGDADAIDVVRKALDAENIFARVVKTGGKAYHSHHMNSSAHKYEELVHRARETVSFGVPLITDAVMVSSVMNSRIEPGQVIGEKYWTLNLTSPVLFNQAVQTIATSSDVHVDTLIEIGPHTALSGPIKQISKELGSHGFSYLPTLVRNEDSAFQILKLAGELFLRNYPLNMERATAIEETSTSGKLKLVKGSILVDLPTYQWTYSKSLWAEPRQSLEHRAPNHPRHDVLGSRMPGGSASEPVWRNVLRIRDVPWLKDHSLGGEAVFPAAGYFSMAIEAITQLNECSAQPVNIEGFVLRDISIKAALVTPDDDNGIEVLFAMRPSLFSGGESNVWWDFNVSSVSGSGLWNDHMTGTISINSRARGQTPKKVPNLPQRAMGKSWNQGLREVGFDYGLTFQDMEDIRSDGKTYRAASRTFVKQQCGVVTGESRYALHPGTVDSCLQLIIVSIYAGKLNDMTCGAVPIQVDEVAIWPPTAQQLKTPMASAYSYTGQRGIRSFVSGSQLVASDGELLMDITNMRCVAYEAAVPQRIEEVLEPKPFQELVWEYDIDSINSDEQLREMDVGKIVELVGHKSPDARVLEFGSENLSSTLDKCPYVSYTVAVRSTEALEESKAQFEGIKNASFQVLDISVPLDDDTGLETFDLIIATRQSIDNVEMLKNLRSLLAPSGRVIFAKSSVISQDSLVSAGFNNVGVFLEDSETKALSFIKPVEVIKNGLHANSSSPQIKLIYRNKPAAVIDEIAKAIEKGGYTTSSSALATHGITCGHAVVIGDLEGSSLLATMEETEFEALKELTNKASSILWVTAGGLLTGKLPEYAMANGLARSLTSEQSSLDFTTLDFDLETTSPRQIADSISAAVQRQVSQNESRESEYYVSKGYTYISRLLANTDLPGASKAGKEYMAPYEGQHLVGSVQSGKVVFSEDELKDKALDGNEVEVKVVYGGLNKEDTLVITGNDYPMTFSHEISGVVSRVGSAVKGINEGDMVVGFSFDKFSTLQRTSADLLQKVEKGESLEQISSLPWTFSTALYGLRDLAKLEPNEKVLILSGTGSVGAAAIQITRLLGGIPFVVVASSEQQRLMATFGLPEQQVLNTDNITSQDEMLALTKGSGFDVVFSGYTDFTEAREAWRHIRPLGRFVDFGRKNVLKRSAIDTVPIHNGASYLSFDMLDLYACKPQILSNLLKSTLSLYRQGLLSPISSPNIYSLDQLDSAVSSYSEGFVAGKTLISYAPSGGSLSIVPNQTSMSFRSDATYLLVGCLGGLGRSLTTWMTENGARRLVFLSRSGADQEQAGILIRDLEKAGIICQVVRGDVTNRSDVQKAVDSVPVQFPIRGVVQAAMVLRDGLFHSMTYSNWTTATYPKVRGTLNLHNVLSDTPLDFFIMTSSTSGTLGTPGQANYSAANSFLDSLARHRVSNQQRACSVVLPMILGVGYVAEHPEVEEALRRKGIYGIDETHLLESLAVSMLTQASPTPADHVIVGLDPVKLQKSIRSSETTDGFWFEDARFKPLLAFMTSSDSNGVAEAGRTILSTIHAADSPAGAVKLTSEIMVDKLARLLLVDLAEFEPDVKSIASYGLDSMIGAELRNWIFKELALDIPFQRLLSADLTITKFATEVCNNQGIVLDSQN
ncbi:putative polyketide synthase [Talaromyces proteolyticus]|uniref:Polyketide synthase n=1 Tax=Talaromyces proteolyticus TaxID=1131652 RepID=A0AAD4KZC1_9EURO|nr:putative polyketide synthase [Talaromyces proteolyticus]KAH8704702.1 putative polyketide synthase [Talaromyces proteolyticus]